ncbi:MAG: transcriptional repressor NrdR [Phycisphaerales bacterium]|nr:transcriptional repressor NrdR [Phycisphaerales bacterium]MCB9836858.1 transcriptional repressor NrdR [Phycisphaera sp.]
MICPYCEANDDKVIDSRASDGGKVIRRRRECIACQKRFTTYERVEQSTRLLVVKKDGTREPFDREKISGSIHAACGKRKIPAHTLSAMIDEIEEELHRQFEREVETRIIGERVMVRLKDADEVAYIRFASEYYQFRNVDDISRQIQELNARIKDVKNQQSLFKEP